MSSLLFRSIVLGVSLSSLTAMAVPDVEWSNASSAGSGCPGDSAYVTITPGGDEIAWTFSEFGFDLSAGPDTTELFCRLSAFADVKKGLYIAEISQELSYAGSKSTQGSHLSLGVASSFFGSTLPLLSKTYGEGVAFASGFESIASTKKMVFPGGVVAEDFCEGDRPQGLFQSTVSAIGRVSQGGFASLSVQGQNVTFKATTTFKECPES